MRQARRITPIAALFLATTLAVSAHAADEFGPNPTWQAPTPEKVRTAVFEWLDSQPLDDAARKPLAALWPAKDDEASPSELLERLAETFSAADPKVKKLVELCAGANTLLIQPDFAWLLDEQTPAVVRDNMRLYYARWLTQEKLYDEALAFLVGLEPDQVVDPAALLFYQSVSHHRLVNMNESRQAAQRLLQREKELPRRYEQIAQLLGEDLKALKEDTLDHIARRMDDIGRRLDLGRAGKKVIALEDGVIDSLDKLIKEIEEQQQKQQQSASSGSQGNQSGRPMQDSRIASQKGPGQVEKKNVGSRSGWGDLPPKQREQALQQIGKEFPAHYRDAIEQFFRKVAGEGSSRE